MKAVWVQPRLDKTKVGNKKRHQLKLHLGKAQYADSTKWRRWKLKSESQAEESEARMLRV
jgi:hypothetical protein